MTCNHSNYHGWKFVSSVVGVAVDGVAEGKVSTLAIYGRRDPFWGSHNCQEIHLFKCYVVPPQVRNVLNDRPSWILTNHKYNILLLGSGFRVAG